MKYFVPAILALLLLAATPPALALEPVSLHAQGRTPISGQLVEVLEDPTGELSYADVSSAPYEARFMPYEDSGAVNFGLSQSAYWLRFTLQGEDSEGVHTHHLLEIAYFSLSEVDLYPPDAVDPIATGYDQAITDRPWPHRHYVFPIELEADDKDTYYLRVKSSGSLTVPLVLWDPVAFQFHDKLRTFGIILYFGVVVGLLVYNLFLYTVIRERTYLIYCAFLFCAGGAMFIYSGYRSYLLVLFGDWPATLDSDSLFAMSGFFALWFARDFLDLPRYQPGINKVIPWVMAATLFIASMPLLQFPIWYAAIGVSVIGMVIAPLVTWAAWTGWRRGHSGARYLLLAWGALMTAVFIQALRNFGFVPTNMITSNLLQIGSLLDMLLLAFALADRIQTERRGRELAQTQALKAERKLVEGLRASEQRLEHIVEDRTHALERALERERETLDRYKQFAGLISHEFRNPLAVIRGQSNVAIKERDRGIGCPTERFETIDEAAGRLQVLFEQWLETDRLSKSGQKLELKRLVLADWLPRLLKPGNLRLGHPLVFGALDGVIEADEALVGSAFHNLIDNAAKYSPAGSDIEVSTTVNTDEVGIHVKDSGIGLSPEEQRQIFDKYYRASESQSTPGLGLGLFFVDQVMQAHAGRVCVDTKPGVGSTFTLWFSRR